MAGEEDGSAWRDEKIAVLGKMIRWQCMSGRKKW